MAGPADIALGTRQQGRAAVDIVQTGTGPRVTRAGPRARIGTAKQTVQLQQQLVLALRSSVATGQLRVVLILNSGDLPSTGQQQQVMVQYWPAGQGPQQQQQPFRMAKNRAVRGHPAAVEIENTASGTGARTAAAASHGGTVAAAGVAAGAMWTCSRSNHSSSNRSPRQA